MIPQRVKLKGFLCYKEEQQIEFDGAATLWMLAGLNGSGKSAIFDAVTYALFGYHRGGTLHAHELINKESDSLLVEFDFLLDGKLYRAKRTQRRNAQGGSRGTQQMYRCERQAGIEGEAGHWVALEGTGQKGEFNNWVTENLGLNYDTFTSSVLLLQGKADKLLDSTPAGRREVLARIVDLGRYEKLFQKADEARKSMESSLKMLTSRLAALPVVQPLELLEARNRIADAEQARTAARAQVELLQGMEFQSLAWRDLGQQLVQARHKHSRALEVLRQASAIEHAVERLRELREVLPRLHEVVILRGQAHQADEVSKAHQRDREKQVEQLASKKNDLEQAHQRRQVLHGQIARDEVRHRDLAGRLRVVTVQLTRLRECERQELDLARLRQDLGRLPADPATLAALAREEFDALDGLSRVEPALIRFQARRADLARAVEQEREFEQQLKALRQRGEGFKAEGDALRPRLEEAVRVLEQATERATEARTLLGQARANLQEVSQLDGARTCRHCGQALTPGHIDEEKRKRGVLLKEAEKAANLRQSELEKARAAEQEVRQRLDRADKSYAEAREEYRERNAQLKTAKGTVEQYQRDCASIHAELPGEYQARAGNRTITDWLQTVYPQPADLAEIRAQLRGLEGARKKLREAEKVWQLHGQLKAQEATTLDNLNRHLRDMPTDREGLRREHADLEAQEKELFRAVDAARKQVREVEQEVERLTRERDQAQAVIGQTDTRLREQHLVKSNAERGIEAQMKVLPVSWHAQARTVGMNQLHVLRGEQKHLEEEGTDESARELEQARHSLAEYEAEVKRLETREKEFPPEARQEPAVIASRLAEARQQDRGSDEVLAQARQALALLENQEQQRQQIDTEYRALEGELVSQRLLADLLGRDRLQLYLVRQAERQVVEFANHVLDRLSGGQLYLKLAGAVEGEDSSAKALELEAFNRATGEKPINVAFLSGSQKFRVAVALALGIGQYASRQHRPIESVIIDEGFGCLDSQGRQVMIQELQNLRSQMRCILLVSHQEDFAEAFGDGYHFKLHNGATRVERFRR